MCFAQKLKVKKQQAEEIGVDHDKCVKWCAAMEVSATKMSISQTLRLLEVSSGEAAEKVQ